VFFLNWGVFTGCKNITAPEANRSATNETIIATREIT